jgi:sugar lactone lactonase YvrE
MRHATRLLLGFAMLAAWPLVAATPAGALRTGTTQGQIAAAFQRLQSLPSVARGEAYLQGYDEAMRDALQQAGTQFVAGNSGKPLTVRFSTGPDTVVRPGQAMVPLTISVHTTYPPPSYSDSFDAVALRVGGRWKVSWTTMCLLVETDRQLCPPTPRHLVAGDIVPTAGRAAAATAGSAGTAGTSGLVGPGPLAMAPDGGVLIADADRNQILEWHSGTLSVVAGDGLSGFSGDGGPAVDAELDGPGPIAVAPDGTICFVDRGNNRVRAVNPDGTITTVAGDGALGSAAAGEIDGRPATSVPLNPSGIAVTPEGNLYVASNSAIVEVHPDGLVSTLVAGGPPAGVDVNAGGGPVAFFPTAMAFDGQGDLLVFSFSPKELFSVDPATGQVSLIGQNYANALAPAPDGSVLVAEHGGPPERVSGNSVTDLKLTSPLQGPGYPLVADGIAEAADGTVYVDTDPGDGFNDQVDLYEVSGDVVQPVPLTTPELSSLPAPGAPGFSASVFPLSISAHGTDAALTSCPSPAGVVPFTPAAEAAARLMLGLWNSGFSYNLHASDRSWWPELIATYAGGRQTVGAASPATGTLYAPAIAAACGQELVHDSIAVVMEASEYSFSVEHLYLLDRDGTPLVYFSGY